MRTGRASSYFAWCLVFQFHGAMWNIHFQILTSGTKVRSLSYSVLQICYGWTHIYTSTQTYLKSSGFNSFDPPASSPVLLEFLSKKYMLALKTSSKLLIHRWGHWTSSKLLGSRTWFKHFQQANYHCDMNFVVFLLTARSRFAFALAEDLLYVASSFNRYPADN